MKNDPIVTIGIPVYNGERVVGERIKQILNQTFQDFIIVISDNIIPIIDKIPIKRTGT